MFRTLLEGRFQEYVEAQIGGYPLWLFAHVPKTAGSSLNGELVPLLQPNYHIVIDYQKVAQAGFNALMEQSVSRFIAACQTRRYRFCTGHIHGTHVEQITAAIADVRPVTLIRHPVARFVSDDRYQCSELHPGHQDFRARHPVIDSYLEMPGEWNKLHNHLVPPARRHAGMPEKAADYLLDTYGFIGIQEQYALSLRLLTTLLGAPRRPRVFRRVNTPSLSSAVALSPALEDQIRACNALDMAIYSHIEARFEAIANDLAAFLDVIDPLPPEQPAASPH